ncbi:MAG: hypothetical protein ABEI78_01740 [Candidatus Nanohaloarchaea archaeon]
MAWLDDLPGKLRSSLNYLLDKVEQQEEVYESAENEAVAQIWVAMAQMNQRVQRLERLVKAQRKALNSLDESVDVDQQLDQNLEKSLKRY